MSTTVYDMMGPTHTLVALAGGVVVASVAAHTYQDAGALVVAGMATAKLPDIDCKLPGAPHRGPATHSLLAVLVLAALVAVPLAFLTPEFAPWIVAGVALGTGLHVLADALTISGVPMLWPLVRRDVHLLPGWARVRTDGPLETVFAGVLAIGLLGFVWMTYGGTL